MTDDFKKGVHAAASVIGDFSGSTTHLFRLDDVVLCKLNVVKRKRPRKNKKALQPPDEAWNCGLATALAEVHRRGGNSTTIVEVANNCGLTLAVAKADGVSAFDWKELKRAGVK